MKYVLDLLTLDEACQYLGITRNTLDKLVAESDFPITQIGERNPRVKFEHMQMWIDKNTVNLTQLLKANNVSENIEEIAK